MPQVSNVEANEAATVRIEKAEKLHQAVIQGNLDEVNALLNDDVSIIDAQDQARNTALYYAVLNNRPDITYALVTAGADLWLSNPKGGYRPIELAEKLDHSNCSYVLLGAKLCEMVRSYCLGELKSGPRSYVLEELEFLLRKGAVTDLTLDKTKNTALHYAFQKGDAAMANALLAAGADFRLLNADNLTPLDMSETLKHEDCKSAISKAKKNFELCEAAKGNDIAKVRVLLNDNVDANSCLNEERNTPLHYAVQNNNIEMIHALLEKEATGLQENKNGLKPLGLAIEMKHWESFHVMAKNKYQFNHEIKRINQHVLDATKNHDPVVLAELVPYYMPYHYPALECIPYGNTALHYAVIHNDRMLALALLEKDEPNFHKNKAGLTAAELACSLKQWQMVSIILEQYRGTYLEKRVTESENKIIDAAHMQEYKNYIDENISYLINAAQNGDYSGFLACLKKNPYLLKEVVADQKTPLINFIAINEPEFYAKIIYDIAYLDREYDFISSIEQEGHSVFALSMMHDIALSNKYYGQLENQDLIALTEKINSYIGRRFDSKKQELEACRKALKAATKLKNELSHRAINFQQSLDLSNLSFNSKALEEVDKKIKVILEKSTRIGKNYCIAFEEKKVGIEDIRREFYAENEQLKIILLKKIIESTCHNRMKMAAFAKLSEIADPIAQRYIADLNAEGKAFNGLSKKEQAKFALAFYNSEANKGDDPCELQKILLEAKQLKADEESFLKKNFVSLRSKLKPNSAAAKSSSKGKMSFALKLAFRIIAKKQAEYLKFKAKEFILATTASADRELRCEALDYAAIFNDDKACLSDAKQLNAAIFTSDQDIDGRSKFDALAIAVDKIKMESLIQSDLSAENLYTSQQKAYEELKMKLSSSVKRWADEAAAAQVESTTTTSESTANVSNSATIAEGVLVDWSGAEFSTGISISTSSAVNNLAKYEADQVVAEFTMKMPKSTLDTNINLIDFSEEEPSYCVSQNTEKAANEQRQYSTAEIIKLLDFFAPNDEIELSLSPSDEENTDDLSDEESKSDQDESINSLLQRLQTINVSDDPLPDDSEKESVVNNKSESIRLAL